MTTMMIEVLLVLAVAQIQVSQAGNCWTTQTLDGRCWGLIRAGVSKENCCDGSSASRAWNSVDAGSSLLFQWRVLGRGAPGCEPCQGELSGDSCEDVVCPRGKTCVMDQNEMPECRCDTDCDDNDEPGPICGTDGETYSDECTLHQVSCQRNLAIDVAYHGPCQASCDTVHCHTEGDLCVVDQNNVPHCVPCSYNCSTNPTAESRVCGVNGVTYLSMCHLQQATCTQGRSIGLAYYGECQGPLTCDFITCSPGKQCLTNPVTQGAQCVTCGLHCSPQLIMNEVVCGSDGTTYRNWCEMRRAACQSGFTIDTIHVGPCEGDDIDWYDEYDDGQAFDQPLIDIYGFFGTARR